MALCVGVRVHPTLPSHSKSVGHRLDGESRGIPWHPGGFSLFFGVMAVCRCHCSYNRKVGPPLFSILHLVFHFFLFQNLLFLAHISPDSQVTALYYFLLITLNSAASIPKPGVCATQEVSSLSLV